RDLHSFETTLDTTSGLLDRIPDDRLVITESGIHTVDDVKAMQAQGVCGFLLSEAFMGSADAGARLAVLFFQRCVFPLAGAENHHGLAVDGDEALVLEGLENAPHHLPGATDDAADLLAGHLDLHAVRVGHGVGLVA